MLKKTDRYDQLINLGEEEARFNFLGPIPTQNPIFDCNAFGFRGIEEFEDIKTHRGAIYGRVPGHPNHVALEKKYGFVAEADGIIIRADGMSIISQILWSLLKPGDRIVASLPLYSGTYEFIAGHLTDFGVHTSFFRASDTVQKPIEDILQELVEYHSAPTKVLYIESCANPTLDLIDVQRAANFCKDRNIILIDDITFMSVFMQNSLNLGADIIIEAITKHMSGGRMMGGVATWQRESLNKKLWYWRFDIDEVVKKMVCLGGTMNYTVAHAFSQNIKTLFILIKQKCRNALRIARWLRKQDGLIVKYPGLPSHPQYELACRQMVDEDGHKNFGCMIYFDLGGDEQRAREFAKAVASTQKIMLAVSLAAPETIITHVWTMIFGGLNEQEKIKLGISPTAFRLSVGLQPMEETCAALQTGFSAIKL